MDLAVDEQGLWALWADTDNSYRLYASKIDVHSDLIIDTRALTTGKSMCLIHLQWNLSNFSAETKSGAEECSHILIICYCYLRNTSIHGKGTLLRGPEGDTLGTDNKKSYGGGGEF